MSNTLLKPTTSSVHVIITSILGAMVTALCCYVFYSFRMGNAKEQSFTDAMKVIRAATEIVASMAERGIPVIRGRIDELESRGRMLEQHQRKIAERLSQQPLTQSVPGPVEPTASTSEASLLAARRIARMTAPAPEQ